MAQDSMTTALRQRRENALADMINLGLLSASEAAPLRESDPWRFVLATEPVGKDLAEFLDDFPEARVALLQGQEVSFPYSTLAPQLQDVVRRIVGSIESLQESIGLSATHEELMARPDRWQITVGGQLNTGKTDVVSQATLGSITIRTVGDTADMLDWPILDPSSAVAKALGRAVVGLQSGLSKETVAANLKAEMAQAAEAEDALSQPTRDITSDPALRQQITLFDQTTIAPLPTTIDALARASGLNIVSDYFPGKPVSMESEKKTLGETLEKISEGYSVNWTKAGGILRFTDREWFNKRAYEVPQVWIDYWMQRGKLNNGLLLEDLVQIGNLRDEQIENTIMTNRKLVGMGAGDAARNREILRFYGSLSADQMADIASKSLPVNTLTVEQWAALQKALASKGAVYAAAQQGEQYVRLTQSGSDIIEYKFSYHPAGGEAPVTFILRSGLVYDIADDK